MYILYISQKKQFQDATLDGAKAFPSSIPVVTFRLLGGKALQHLNVEHIYLNISFHGLKSILKCIYLLDLYAMSVSDKHYSRQFTSREKQT